LVMVLPFALHVGRVRATDIRSLVPLQPEPAQAVHQVLGRAFDEALAVGVLDTEDEGSLLACSFGFAMREEHVVHDEAGTADVERPGRARGESHAHLIELVRDALWSGGRVHGNAVT